MTISFMRVVDRFAGIPLCWAAGLARAVLPKRKPPSLETILVIKFFGLGSILLASPALREIRRSSPNVTIIFLTFAQNAELLNELHLVDELWTIDPKSVFTFVATTFRTLSNITRTTIDAVLDLEFFAKLSTLLGAFANPA
ncbi:MAG TPA: hypothetical protein VMH23_17750, partial [Bacteroidota bacterium]|nr:hypothetical protein [Bacteroidota bacterium]